jgi:hypothetical protein
MARALLIDARLIDERAFDVGLARVCREKWVARRVATGVRIIRAAAVDGHRVDLLTPVELEP